LKDKFQNRAEMRGFLNCIKRIKSKLLKSGESNGKEEQI
jgi:hypothetical protein